MPQRRHRVVVARARRGVPGRPSARAAPRRLGSWRPRRAAGGRRASRAAAGPRGCAGARPASSSATGSLVMPIERPSRRRASGSSSGTHVGTPQLGQLHAVLERAQEPVGLVEGGAVLPSDVAARVRWASARQRGRGARTSSSARPCTSWSSWTANSTSRRPPEPSLIWRSACAAGMCSTTRRRIACTSVTKPSRSAARPDHRGDPRRRTRAPSSQVARDRSRLEQRLELPGLGPACS